MPKVKCLNCSKDFIPKRTTAKFCSTKCRVAFNRKPEEKSAQIQNTDIYLPGNIGTIHIGQGTHEILQSYKKKDGSLILTIGGLNAPATLPPSNLALEAAGISKKTLVTVLEGTFMGHEIPKDLKGIDLTIWKAEIKGKQK